MPGIMIWWIVFILHTMWSLRPFFLLQRNAFIYYNGTVIGDFPRKTVTIRENHYDLLGKVSLPWKPRRFIYCKTILRKPHHHDRTCIYRTVTYIHVETPKWKEVIPSTMYITRAFLVISLVIHRKYTPFIIYMYGSVLELVSGVEKRKICPA